MRSMTGRRAFLTAGVSTLGATVLRPGEGVARELGAGRSGYSDRSKYGTSERYFTGARPLPRVRMPNRDGFVDDPRPDVATAGSSTLTRTSTP